MMTEARDTRRKIYTQTSDLIGGTPLYELVRTGSESRLLLKLEQFNPTGSCKVRMAQEMIQAAARSGKLKPGGHIVESTSGNTGLGLAFVAIELGYKFTAVVDQHASPEKLRAMQAMGVNLVIVEGSHDQPSTVERRRRAAAISAATGAFWPDQHYNPDNNAAYAKLASELLADLNGDIDYLVGAVGTGGTLCGTVKELRRRGSRVISLGVEPTGSIIFGGPGGPYYQTGAGAPAGFTVGPNVDHSLINEGVTIDDIDAFTTARVVARRTGILVGGTAGAAIYLALKRLALIEPHSVMVVLVCDAGEKYLNSIYNEDWLHKRNLLSKPKYQSLHRLFDAYLDSTRISLKHLEPIHIRSFEGRRSTLDVGWQERKPLKMRGKYMSGACANDS